MSETLRRALLLAVAAGLVALALLRGAALAAAPPGDVPALLTAHDERRWYGWAQRHPRMRAAFAAAADRLPPGARAVWVVPPGVQPRWVEIMALYHLPAAWPAAVRNRGTVGGRSVAEEQGRAADWRVDVYADGRVAVKPVAAR